MKAKRNRLSVAHDKKAEHERKPGGHKYVTTFKCRASGHIYLAYSHDWTIMTRCKHPCLLRAAAGAALGVQAPSLGLHIQQLQAPQRGTRGSPPP